MQNHNNEVFDMATAVKTVRPFEGEEGEDIDTWWRDLLLIGEVACWTEDNITRVAIMCLIGKALSWASQVLRGKIDQITLETLIAMTKKRFGSSSNKEVALTKFINLPTAKSNQEYSEMLRMATAINEKDIITRQTLAQMVVQNTPSDIRGCLYQAGLAANS
ncbi:hypothetical protein NGRA_2142 [Nosema granulosis]|uniref:Uncharacterized protein n=1 Tax=Nosema granulosis TaxID=83296 RepID=A0A9P6H0G1_9MICR|nr:hypothetical protein NGRA_2142 [Nosema granulosis]